ncbi:MAG: helix-turn-helix transcriptional regulator [Clostridia bacterium]|nr:helix-turn-helix transcriptional regulator [Clostridia bacterium]
MTNIQRDLARTEFDNRENLFTHLPYDRETAFYRAIQAGDREEALRLSTPLGQEGFGRLSDDPIQNLRYHLVITVAFITRYCMAGGLDAETAFNLSDLYIRRIDRCRAEAEIHALHRELIDDYAGRMRHLQRHGGYPRPILRCTEHIHTHLHRRITVEELCSVSGLSRAYLSRLFRREVGMPIGEYVTRRRLEAARKALEFTDQSIPDIAHTLAFSSESHFISVFRRYCGMTPGEYRRHAPAITDTDA